MNNGWYNIPWYVYAIGCAIIAILYLIIPVAPYKNYLWDGRSLMQVILRWFHSIVWILLAAACLYLQVNGEAGMEIAKQIALVGLGCYLIYLAVFVRSKQKNKVRGR